MTPEAFRADRLRATNNVTNTISSAETDIGGGSSLLMTAEQFKEDRLKARATAAADNIRFDDNVVDFGENEPEASAYNIDFDATRKKADLKKGIEAELLRDYMIQRFGEDYRRNGQIDNHRTVEDFFGHMRHVKCLKPTNYMTA